MKKVMLGLAAAAAMAGAGGAFAQSADCARGMFGQDPCGSAGVVIPNQPNGGTGIYDYRTYNGGIDYQNGNPGRYPGAVLGAGPFGYQYQVPQDLRRSDREARRAQREAQRNDRDGDGVRNSRDRYPDDGRYR